MDRPTIFRLRTGTTAQWASSSRILKDGEPGYDRELHILKIGDGLHVWNELDPLSIGINGDGSSDAAVLAHINSLTPHPVYDDGPSLSLLYENAKV